MADQDAPLSDEERAELESLRAEKAAREEEAKARQEREEIARLRAEKAEAERRKAEDERVERAREHGRELMEPDDDLSMPKGQKLVLLGIAVLAVALVVMTLL